MKNKTTKGLLFFSLTAISFVFIALSMIMNIARENMVSIKKRQYASLQHETRLLDGKLNKKIHEMNMEMSYSNIASRAEKIDLIIPRKQLIVVKVNRGEYDHAQIETSPVLNMLANLRINQNAKASDDIR